MNFRKFTVFILVIALGMNIVACSKEPVENAGDESLPVESNNNVDENNVESNSENTSIEVDENLLTVDVTLPASFFEGSNEEEIISNAKKEGYISAKVNDNGSVTYTMTRAKRNEMLKGMEESINESIQEMLQGDEKVESFIDIKHNNNFSEFDIYVDPDKYTDWDSFYSLTFYMFGAFYQNIDGVSPEDIDIIVRFIDNNTKEVIDTGSYKDVGED